MLTRLSAFNQINTLIHRSRPHVSASAHTWWRARVAQYTSILDIARAWINVFPCLVWLFSCRFLYVSNARNRCALKNVWMRNVPISFDLRCHRMLIYKYNKNNCSPFAIHEAVVHHLGWRWPGACWLATCTSPFFIVAVVTATAVAVDVGVLHLYRLLNVNNKRNKSCSVIGGCIEV